MLKNLFSKTTYTKQDLLDELLYDEINKKKLDKIYNASDIDLNWLSEEGESFIHICIEEDCIDSVRWLIKNGADVNLEGTEKRSPLFYALKTNNINMLSSLIENGANVNAIDEHNRSLAQEAILLSNQKVIEFILKKSKNLDNCDVYGNNIIFDAIANGNKDLIKKIAQNQKVNINQINKEGNTILQKEDIANNKEMAKFLMELGVDPTIRDATGKNFLFYAVSKGIENIDIIEKAVILGCDLNSRSITGENLLHEAVKHYILTKNEEDKEKREETRTNYKKMIEQLLLRDIDIDATNEKEENVLFELVREREYELIEFLLNEQIHINQKNIEGDTILSILIVKGAKDLDLIDLLLRYSLNPDIQNNIGESAIETIVNIILHIENRRKLRIKIKQEIDREGDYIFLLKTILRTSQVDLKQLNSKGEPLFFESILYFNNNLFNIFKDHNINLNMKDKNGNNILYALMEHNKNNKIRNKKKYLTLMQSLINIGVNVNTTNNEGLTLLHIAVTQECEYTFRVLLHAKANLLATDKKGRTIMHNCIWKESTEKYFKYIHNYTKELLDVPDMYGIQPVNYAAFMGKKELVIQMLDEGASLNNLHEKDEKMMLFFEKFHKNILQMDDNIYNEIDKKNLNLLKESMIKDFNIISHY